MVFLDYTTATIGSSEGDPVLKYTVPYKCMITVQITQMETNSKSFSLYRRVAGDSFRRDYFIFNQNDTSGSGDTYAFGLTKVMQTGEQIFGGGDLSPFAATLHIFRLPESP